jgi:lipid II:glycine glycyltransferase (peptidoglycan interpeptide bridge formation enzyme)
MTAKTSYVITRLKLLENEIERLREHLKKSEEKRTTKIEGLWKGINVTEEDIEEAKRSLFKGAYEFGE